MVYAVPEQSRFAPVPALSRLRTRSPSASEAFNCGVRVIKGTVAGEGWRWRYRRSFVEPQRGNDVTALHHGAEVVLRLRIIDGAKPHRLRPHYVRITATEVESGAQLRLSCRPEVVHRLKGLG